MEARQTFKNLPEGKQRNIIDGALEEFSDKGYQGASINAMVKKLGIAKGSIFQYFGDKKGLFLFIFNKSMDLVKDYLKAVRDQTHEERLQTRLEKTLVSGVIFLREHPRIYRLYLKIMFESGIPFRHEILQSIRDYSLEYFKSLLTTALERGELRRGLDVNKAIFLLDAVMDRFLQAQMISPLGSSLDLYDCNLEEAEAWIGHIVEILSRGIASGTT